MVGFGSVSFVDVCLHLTQTNPLSSRVSNRNSVARNCAQPFFCIAWNCAELRCNYKAQEYDIWQNPDRPGQFSYLMYCIYQKYYIWQNPDRPGQFSYLMYCIYQEYYIWQNPDTPGQFSYLMY